MNLLGSLAADCANAQDQMVCRSRLSGGGPPLIGEGGTYIGSVGVSGLPDVEDYKLITSCLTALLVRQPTPST
ncbi:heme-binding protein [Agrobacterium fabrum]|uniref:heme-binding protein n=1 Tax=Agrobacterium fabrum TaxID=1176649 RepID=UPI000B8989FE|nr:heme-binding protein [Agrobacterium fabrum]